MALLSSLPLSTPSPPPQIPITHKFPLCCCSCSKLPIQTTDSNEYPKQRRNRNPTRPPSFHQLVREKWSLKNVGELQKRPEEVGVEEKGEKRDGGGSRVSELELDSVVEGGGFCDWGEIGGAQVDNDGKLGEVRLGVEDSGDGSGVSVSALLRIDEEKTCRDVTGEKQVSVVRGSGDFISRMNLELLSARDQAKEESESGGMAMTLSNYVADGEVLWREIGDRMWMQEEVEGHETKNVQEASGTLVREHELNRLRNVALRMKERIKVGVEGVSEALVSVIHEKWKIDEVVKLKFEGTGVVNMRRIHEVLERRTGGLVIWGCGSSLVLFRGTTSALDSSQSCGGEISVSPHPSMPPKGCSNEKLVDKSELKSSQQSLDRTDHEPLPVDADMLPGVVQGYKPPFRLLPIGLRRRLKGKEITLFRRLAGKTHPHFVLGRSRELEGLAEAMVKLWKTSAIAKIAIKPGVPDTSIDRMAEELKRLTGGALLSMNKECILFHRGNDFLAPDVAEALRERQSLKSLKHEEEARGDASEPIDSQMKVSRLPLVAGTLAETTAAISFWGDQQTKEDLEEKMKELAAARHASLVNQLEKKVALAEEKLKNADKALLKVQECLVPAELPSDLEIITDEERFLFHKMGLSMKPYLLLGRRGVFDGTIQNMHLHWKYRELVKIIVKRKSLAQVKHIAISLEAESGGVLISIDETVDGTAIIIYRGRNYKPPLMFKPKNLLSKRQALARSVELQRREALKHHIADLREKIHLLVSSKLEDSETAEEAARVPSQDD